VSDRRRRPADIDGTSADGESDELAARLELLAAENRRLREENRNARRTSYRATGFGLAGLGGLALVGAAMFPVAREVLLALSGTGLFAAVLVYTLTPERFVAASVGQRIYEAHAAAGQELSRDLGLADARVYVPVGDDCRLFVPQHDDYVIPEDAALSDPLVVTAGERHRGLALPPTGAGLYGEFERELAGSPPTEPARVAEQLSDALVEGFELVDGARPDVEPGRLTVAVEGSAYGDPTRFDHPVASFLAVGTATALAEPVTLEVAGGDDRADAILTCRWAAEGS
jgi:hypothetical protein